VSRRARQRPNRRVILNPIQVAIANASRLEARDRANLSAIMADALDKFRRGIDCPDHWRSMADALNMAENLAGIGIASDEASRQRIQAGQRVLADVAQRAFHTDSWTLRSPELQALDDALWIHRIQLEHCSLGEYERAERATVNRVSQARAGNAPAGAIVIEGGLGRAPENAAA